MVQLLHHDKSRVLDDALIGTSNGASKPILAQWRLSSLTWEPSLRIWHRRHDLAGNKEAHLRSVTDNQVEQCHEGKVYRWRFVDLDKVLPLALGKIIAWCITESMSLLRAGSPGNLHCSIFPANKTMFMFYSNLYDQAKLAIRVAHNRAANPALLLAIAASSVVAWNGPRDCLMAAIYKAVISPSLTLCDSNPCLAKQNGTANEFACLFEKLEY